MVNRRLTHLIVAVGLASAICSAQTPTSDPQALALVAKSFAVLTSGVPVGGVTLNAAAISIAGSDYFTGTATLQAKGITDSRIDLTVNGSTRTEIRTLSGGMPSGTWTAASTKAQPFAQHNCWTDAAWFFPALSSLSQTTAGTFFYSYIGQEQHDGLSVQHLRVFRHLLDLSPVDTLSATDIYLDPVSFLPMAVAFNVHPDNDMNRDIPMEVRFANYQAVSGVKVPFHIQQLLNGSLALDLTVTNAVIQ